MRGIRIMRRLAAVSALFVALALVPQPGSAGVTGYQHVGMVWQNYPGGFFGLHLGPTVGYGPAHSYWFSGVVNSQSVSCQPYDNVSVPQRAGLTYVADGFGIAGTGTLTGLANSSCGSRTFTLTFTYTGKGGFRLVRNQPPNLTYNYVILERTVQATGRFCWVGGTGACTNFGTTTNAVAETVVVADT